MTVVPGGLESILAGGVAAIDRPDAWSKKLRAHIFNWKHKAESEPEVARVFNPQACPQ